MRLSAACTVPHSTVPYTIYGKTFEGRFLQFFTQMFYDKQLTSNGHSLLKVAATANIFP